MLNEREEEDNDGGPSIIEAVLKVYDSGDDEIKKRIATAFNDNKWKVSVSDLF